MSRYMELPSVEQIDKSLRDLAKQREDCVDLEVAGHTVEGKPIHLVTVTDKAVPFADKQVALIVTGEHGNEKAGTASVLKLIEWLVTEDAALVRENQSVMLLPLVNVDGYEKWAHFNSNNVDIFEDFEELSQPESQAVWEVVKRSTPDVLVDLHGTTGDLEVWWGEDLHVRPANGLLWDSHVLAQIADQVNAEAARAGYPATLVGGAAATSHLPQRAYDEYHSLCIGIHGAAREEFDVRWKAILEVGNRRWPTEYYPGYPNSVIAMGDASTFLTAYGDTAEERRRSRVELWRSRDHITILEAVPPKRGLIIALVQAEDYPPTMAVETGVGLRFRLPKGGKVTSAQMNGEDLGLDDCPAWDGEGFTWMRTGIKSRPVERPRRCNFAYVNVVIKYDG